MKNSILNAMPIVASTYADKFGVNVVPSMTASTDGNTINTVLDETNMNASWGYLCHEAAHIKLSDFTIFTDYQFRNEVIGERLANHPMFFDMVNALEDNRIEYTFMKEYPGMNKTFNAMDEQLIETGGWRVDVNADIPNAVMQYLCIYPAGKSAGLNYKSCVDLSKLAHDTLINVIGINHAEWVENIVMSSVKAKSERECAILAGKLLQYMLDNTPEPLQGDSQSGGQQGNGQGDSQSGGQQGNGQGDSQSGGQQGNGQGDSQSGGQQGNGQGDSQSGGQQGNGQGDSQSGGQQGNGQGDSSQDSDTKCNRQTMFNDHTSVKGQDKGQLVADILNASSNKDGIADNVAMGSLLLRASPVEKDGIIGRFDFDKENVKSKLLRTKVQSFIQTRSRNKRLPSRTGRKLNQRKMGRIAQGYKRPYIRTVNGDSTSTGVYISLDVSSSMNGNERIKMARAATVGIAHVIDSVKDASVSVSAFNTDVRVIKTFSDNLLSKKNAFGVRASGNTDITPALAHGIKELSNCRKSRKIMILLTDGCTRSATSAASMITEIKKSGVDVFGVGIQMGNKRDVMDNLFTSSGWINIEDLNDLNKTLFNFIKHSL